MVASNSQIVPTFTFDLRVRSLVSGGARRACAGRENIRETKSSDVPDTEGYSLLAPSVFAAFRDQLGLNLQRDTGEVEVLVIDSVQMPTLN